MMCLNEVDDLVSEMMDVDDDLRVVALVLDLLNEQLQQRTSSYWHQCLGHGVGEGFEASAETGSEDEEVHFES